MAAETEKVKSLVEKHGGEKKALIAILKISKPSTAIFPRIP